jgi:hypothetical protein
MSTNQKEGSCARDPASIRRNKGNTLLSCTNHVEISSLNILWHPDKPARSPPDLESSHYNGKVWPSGADAYSFISLVELVIGAVQKHSFVCYTPCGKNEYLQEETLAKFLVTYHGAGMPHDPEQVPRPRQCFSIG